MKRAFFLRTTMVAAAVFLAAGTPAARACQYCRQAYEDPDAGRMVTDNRGGSFSLDGNLGQYQAAPPSLPPPPAELKTAPAPGSVVTNAGDLAAGAPGNVPAVHRPVVLPPPAAAKAPVPSPDRAAGTSVAYWSNLCLLGLVAAGGIFCWRTRRRPPVAT